MLVGTDRKLDEQPPRQPYTGSARICNDPLLKFELELPVKHETGSFTGKFTLYDSISKGTNATLDIWPRRRPSYAAQIANYNNPPPKFAAVPTRPATPPRYETGTMDVFGHFSLSSQGRTTLLNTGLSLDSDDVFSCHKYPKYQIATMDDDDDVASPDQNTLTSPHAGPSLDSNSFGHENALYKSITQSEYAPQTPCNRIITDKAIIGC
jgi:hypothetical protein